MTIIPSQVWKPSHDIKQLFCDVEQCRPWTKKEDLPGRSYRTSMKMAHPRLYPYYTHVEMKPLELDREKLLSDYRIKDMNYCTSYKSAYTRKCDCLGTTDKPNVPHTLKYHMLFNYADKLRNVTLRKTPERITEMKSNYKLHLADETKDSSGILSDLRPHVLCKISAVAADAQCKTSSEEQCIQKILDPYISTSQYDYAYISPTAKYMHLEAKPTELITARKDPVYDESFLRKKFLDRFLRKKVNPVPHSGLTTEVRDNYKLPLDELSHKKNLYCSSIINTPLTKGEVMAIPGMYHTDYDHYGHDWPLKSVV